MLFLNRSIPSQLEISTGTQGSIGLDLGGVDLLLDANGELLMDEGGDLSVQRAPDSFITNLLRRIGTPTGGYERLAFTNGGVYAAVDLGWSNPLIEQLSAPLTPAFVDWAQARLTDLTARDPRLLILSVDTVKDARAVHLQVHYTLEGTTKTLNIPVTTG